MTVQVSKDTLNENIYKNFYDLLVSISGFSSIVYPTFPDVKLDSSSDYPIIIINSPDISWDTFTFGKNLVEGTIEIEVYRTTPKDADAYASDISNKIETSKGTLSGVGLRQVKLSSSSSDMAAHGKIKVFQKLLTFSFKFYMSKTFSY